MILNAALQIKSLTKPYSTALSKWESKKKNCSQLFLNKSEFKQLFFCVSFPLALLLFLFF